MKKKKGVYVNNFYFLSLKVVRKIYSKLFRISNTRPICEQDPEIASKLIYDALISVKPVMIARFGAAELVTVSNYLGVKNKKNIIKYIKGEEPNWYWNKKTITCMNQSGGFFPPTIEKIEQFCELMLEDKQHVDILGSWLNNEKFVDENMKAKKIHIRFLEPFWSKNPWSRALKDKKVLVVHPFSETIQKQYKNREYLFKDKDILPKFKSLIVIKAIYNLGKKNDRFKDWFEALEYMKDEIDKVDYDICLIGAGPYGFPLAAHVKRQGKKSVHMGGSLQLLFGIRGKRWEDPNYSMQERGKGKGEYLNLMNNQYWTRANEEETPREARKVEGSCYW